MQFGSSSFRLIKPFLHPLRSWYSAKMQQKCIDVYSRATRWATPFLPVCACSVCTMRCTNKEKLLFLVSSSPCAGDDVTRQKRSTKDRCGGFRFWLQRWLSTVFFSRLVSCFAAKIRPKPASICHPFKPWGCTRSPATGCHLAFNERSPT